MMPTRMQNYIKKPKIIPHAPSPMPTTQTTTMTKTSYSQADQDTFVVLLTGGKQDGWFVEIGSNDPMVHNNTFLLEKKYNWKGLMVEWDGSFLTAYQLHRPRSIYVMGDASKVDYDKVLEQNHFPNKIDYLQIDLDVDNRSTLTTLEYFDKHVFPKHTFGVVTFEQDIYRGDYFQTRSKSREIFQKHGYVRVFGNVSVFFEGKYCPFEDWYAHPELVDARLLQRIVHHPDNHEDILHSQCIEIIKKVV